MPIETHQDLRDHIEVAIQVELSTIPPYLFAMYSIEDQGSEAALLIRSIVAEEMLHAALATNLLLAVGGHPRYDTTDLMPRYPGLLPHHIPPLEVSLQPASATLIKDVFMRIEQPEVHGAPAEADAFETLGQFYHALEIALSEMPGDLFANPQLDRQLSDPSYYAPVAYDAEDSGGLIAVDGIDAAVEAIEIIVHQGEGLSTERWADPGHQELTHYFKLLQISDGTSPLGPVRPVRANPVTADYPVGIQPVSTLFNACYRYLFFILADLYGPRPDKREAVGVMYELMATVMSKLALFLVRQPLGDGTAAGPTFEIFEFATPDRIGELSDLAAAAATTFPELAGVLQKIDALANGGKPGSPT